MLLVAILAAALAEPWQPVTGRAPEVWFASRLAADTPDDARLVMRGYVRELEIYVEDARVYRFEDGEPGRMTLHNVVLPRGSAGKRLYMRVPADATTPYIASSRVVTPAQAPAALTDIATEPLREDLDELLLGTLIATVGLFCIVIGDVRRRGDTRPLLYFGIFSLLYGARLVVQSDALTLAGAPGGVLHRIEWLITYVIPIPGWALARRLIGDGWKSTLRWQVVAFAILAPVGIVSDLIQQRAGTMEAANNLLVVIGGVNVLLNLIVVRQRRDTRVVLVGSALFMLFALANNLASLGVLPFREIDETPGFVLFLAALGVAATRKFAQSEREQIELQSELTAAREIQRSILPASMPDMPGLRFEARYVPATSVAGDLYDVLQLDERRAGVIVADVSGHGIPAALVASMVKVGVTSQARLADDPAAMLRELNAILARDVRRGFVTATYLYFDGERVHVANAGHPAPLLLRDGAVQELGAVNPLLGRFKSATYAAAATELKAGDRILAFTDGVTEARNARGEAFGEERLHAAMAARADIVEAVQAWRGGASDADDLTLVSIEVGVSSRA